MSPKRLMVKIKMGCTAQYETDGQGKVYAKLLVRLFDLVASLVFILHRYERKYLSGYILEKYKKKKNGITSNKGEGWYNK